MKTCKHCGGEYSFIKKFCPRCGTFLTKKIEKPHKKSRGHCTNCGKPIGSDAKFCPDCGAEILRHTHVSEHKVKGYALQIWLPILLIFTGAFITGVILIIDAFIAIKWGGRPITELIVGMSFIFAGVIIPNIFTIVDITRNRKSTGWVVWICIFISFFTLSTFLSFLSVGASLIILIPFLIADIISLIVWWTTSRYKAHIERQKGASGHLWVIILVVVILAVVALVITSMILGAQTHPFWEF